MFTIFDGEKMLDIIITKSAPMQAEYAAGQLRHYLGLMTGALPVVSNGEVSENAINLAGGDAELGNDGFAIEITDKGITITSNVRGIIYGAYELLEMLGCRFFTVDAEKVPFVEKIEMENAQIRQVPRLEYREHNYRPIMRSPKFETKLRLNGGNNEIPEKMGGNISYAWFVHSVDMMVPQEKYAETHPEYYALSGGERKTAKHTAQLCLTNPGTLEAAIESTRAELLAHPEARIISISQNDIDGNFCECEACRAIDEAEHSHAGTMLRFVNAIAERLEPEFPDVIFDTLAYNYTRSAPRITRPRKNVCVRLCSIECCFSHPFAKCDDTSRGRILEDGTRMSFMDDLRGWGAVSKRNYIWDYTTCFAHYPTPHPNWHCLQPNMRDFIANGVTGVFEQANGAFGGGADLNELRAYVIAKLLWDAETDVEKHIREFTDFYYGAAGEDVREYIETLCEKAERENIHVGFNDNPESALFDDAMLDKLQAILDRAVSKVQGDALRVRRIEKIGLCVRYVRLRRDTMLKGIKDPKRLHDFLLDWNSHGLTRMEEWFSRESSTRSFLDGKWRSVDYFQYWVDESPEMP